MTKLEEVETKNRDKRLCWVLSLEREIRDYLVRNTKQMDVDTEKGGRQKPHTRLWSLHFVVSISYNKRKE